MSFNPTKLHPDLLAVLSEYTMIMDCISGSEQVKQKRTLYLPKPDPTNLSEENAARYEQYVERAVFYGVTKHTVNSMVGMVFSREQPSLEVPNLLSYVKTNVDGSGVSLEQQLKKVLFECVSLGRTGLLVDYSKNAQQSSRSDLVNGVVRPTIVRYDAINIVWFETKTVGVESIISLVVLKDSYSVQSDDGYTTKQKEQYKILRLIDGIYVQEIWRNDGQKWDLTEEFVPENYKGEAFDRIPFTFVGSLNNDVSIDDAPILPIADLNIAHYRNSADAEESTFMSGQPTLVVTGLSETWLNDVLKGKIKVGAYGGIPLPEGGSANLIQVSATTMPENGMKDKESQMAALGAQLVTRQKISKTATEISRDSMIEDSVLSSIVRNVEQAYEFCFLRITDFTGVEGFDIKLNTEFNSNLFDPQTYIALTNGYMQSANGKQELFDYLKTTNILKDGTTFEDWNDSIENSLPGVMDA